MFEEIFFPKTAEKYRAGPLAEQRERYLVHLAGLGSTRRSLRKCASDQLSLVRLLNLRGDDQVSIHRIEAAAIIWSGPQGRRCKRPAPSKARARFVSRGVQWLRFLGWLDEPERERHPHHVEVAIFEKWLREERGLSDATTQSYCHAADHFLSGWQQKALLSTPSRSSTSMMPLRQSTSGEPGIDGRHMITRSA